MKFNLDRAGTAYVVRAYAPGRIRIGDRDFASSVIVTATDLIEPWRPRRVAELEAADPSASAGPSRGSATRRRLATGFIAGLPTDPRQLASVPPRSRRLRLPML